jgi:outer membrane protein
MKKLQILLASLLLSLVSVSGAYAQTAAVRLATVDMGRLFEGYFRTAEAQERFQNAVEQAQAQAERMVTEGNALVEEYRRMLEEANNPALSAEARQRIESEAERKAQTIREKEREAQQFQMNTQRALQQRQMNHRQLMMDEIRQVVATIAREKGATLVLDSTVNVAHGGSAVIFSDPSFDITEETLQELNKNQPSR